jgi:hypothetical protein
MFCWDYQLVQLLVDGGHDRLLKGLGEGVVRNFSGLHRVS